MANTLQRFVSLLVSISIIMAAYGLAASLLSLTLADRGLGSWVGIVGGAYFIGLGIGSLRAERVIADVGYLRAYGMLTALACIGTLLVGASDLPWVWVLARGLQGLALGGLFVCIESWLGAVVDASSRGRVLAVYQVVIYVGLIAGQGLMGLLADDLQRAMIVAAILLSLASFPVGSTRQQPPTLVVMPRFRLGELWESASVGVVGSLVSGITTGAVYTVAPAAGIAAGLDESQVAWMMSSFIAGGLVLQLPLGRASDVYDRRLVLGIIGALAAVGALLSMAAVGRPDVLIAVSAFEGGWVFAIYAITLAYTYDRVPPERLVSANATLLAVFCAGSALGSTSSSALLAAMGTPGFYSALVVPTALLAALAFRAYGLYDRLPEEQRAGVVIVPRTSAAVVELDPRIDMVLASGVEVLDGDLLVAPDAGEE